MRHRRLRFASLALVASAAATALVACSSDPTQPSAENTPSGAVEFALQAAPGVTLSSVNYGIVGPASFSKTGNFDVSQSTQIGALIGPLPTGVGYTITLSANSVEGNSSCTGSATFNVAPHQTTPVAVAFLCHEAARTGSLMLNGALNICPSLDAVSANPAEAFVGSAIGLSASAQDPDARPATLSYHWSTSSGSLSDSNAATPTLTCVVPGPVVLNVSASDGDPLAGCADTRAITVQCTAIGGGGSAGAPGSAGAAAGGAGNSGGGSLATAGGGGAGNSGGGNSAGAPGAGSSGAPAGGSPATAGGGGAGNSGGGNGAGAPGAGSSGAPAGGSGGSAGQSGPHIDVYRVGDGSATVLGSSGNPVFVDEYTTDGSFVRSIAMPLTSSGSNRRLVASGTATSEGFMTRSADGRFLLVTGYDAPLPTTGLASTTGTAVPRVVGRIAVDGTVDTSSIVTDGVSGNNPRSVASADGTQIWFTGAAGGVRFFPFGNSSASTTQLSTTVTNLRQVAVFGSQLFVSTSSGSAVRIGAVGTGLPTTSGQTITNLPGFPTGGSPYAFYLADLDGAAGLDTLYVADDGIGLSKYALVGGSWVAKGTVGTPADLYRGVTASVSSGTVTLYATRKGGGVAAGGGELVSLVDASGYNGAFGGTPTLLVSAVTNTAFRGVALAPSP